MADRGSSLVNSGAHLLHRAGQRADRLFAQIVGPELSPRQFAVLAAVASKDGISQIGIVQATGIDRSTTAELVGRLVQSGLLRRHRGKSDARVFHVRLTSRSRDLLDKLRPAVMRVDDLLLQPLSQSERARLLAALERILG
jgi:DNA-binding MarR family transcriptional regulator